MIFVSCMLVELRKKEAVKIFLKIWHTPIHATLIDSIPKIKDKGFLLNTIPGMVPGATEYGDGCLFAERCSQAMDVCQSLESPKYNIETNHFAFCHLYANNNTDGNFTSPTRIKSPKHKIENKSILSIKSLRIWFPLRKGIFLRIANYVKAVDDIDLEIQKGSTLALVGESGCGKTTLGESILGLTRGTQGKVIFNGSNILKLNTIDLKKIRKQIQIVFQDPMGSLSPRMTVEKIIEEGLEEHYKNLNQSQRREKIEQVLKEVGLPISTLERYPHEFSGGQRQRIAIARALILEPNFLVLDEPTSALDVSVQAQVLNLFKALQAKRNLTYLFITHNLSVVKYMADNVAIMYLGKIVESGSTEEIFRNPKHPYTKTLLEAIPSIEERKAFQQIRGDVPSPLDPPNGCHFHPRCQIFINETKGSHLKNKCENEYPETVYSGTSSVRCHAMNKA